MANGNDDMLRKIVFVLVYAEEEKISKGKSRILYITVSEIGFFFPFTADMIVLSEKRTETENESHMRKDGSVRRKRRIFV